MKYFIKDSNPRKAILLFMTLSMVVTLFSGITPKVTRAEETQKETKKIINIAFDNSGSMFWTRETKDSYSPMKSWCRAKYAMEVFASMMNDGDELKIFPINPVSTGTAKKRSVDPIVMNKSNAIEKISDMATVSNQNFTSFNAVQKAYNDLKKHKGEANTETVLIILSDGAFSVENTSKEESRDKILQKLNGISKDSQIQVYYFGIGKEALQFNESESQFKSYLAPDTKDTTDRLVDICNDIFSRSSITVSGEKKNKLKSDISMKRIVVFNQGRDAKIKSMKSKNGKEIKPVGKSYNLAFSSNPGTIVNRPGVGLTNENLYDKDLSGVVTTYENIKAGEYTLDYTGDNVQVFYEVDVKVVLTLKDQKGNEFKSPFKDVNPGKYKLKAKIVDSKTGKNVTRSNLIKIKELSVDVIQNNGKSNTFELKKGDGYVGNITLNENDKTKLLVHGTYSGNNEKIQYEIDNKSDSSGKGFSVTEMVILNLETPQSYYTLNRLQKGEGIVARLTYGGKDMTDEQLANVKITPKTEGLDFSEPQLLSGQSAYLFKAKYKDGKRLRTRTGSYVIQVKASYKNGLSTDNKETKIQIGILPKLVIYLIRLLIFAVIILLVLFILFSRALPKKLKMISEDDNCVIYNGDFVEGISPEASKWKNLKGFPYKKEGKVVIEIDSFSLPKTAVSASVGVVLTIKAVSPKIVKSRNRKYKITDIKVTDGEEQYYSIDIGGRPVEYVEGEGLKMTSPIDSRKSLAIDISRTIPEVRMRTLGFMGNLVAR